MRINEIIDIHYLYFYYMIFIFLLYDMYVSEQTIKFSAGTGSDLTDRLRTAFRSMHLGVEKGQGRLGRELWSLHQRPPARWRGTAEVQGEPERKFRSLHVSRPPAVLGTSLYG